MRKASDLVTVRNGYFGTDKHGFKKRHGGLRNGDGLISNFHLTRPLLLREFFSKTSPSPLNLKRGSTSLPAPSPQERTPTGKPAVLYSQASARPQGVARDCLRNKIAII